jgi:hypothetical protein
VSEFKSEPTQFGFKWGAVEVARICSDAKFGVILELRTRRAVIEIRATPSGLLKIERSYKP